MLLNQERRQEGWFVKFYGISALGGYLMLKLIYTNIKSIKLVRKYFEDNILNKPELICLHMVKCFQVLLSKTNNSIQHCLFVCVQSSPSPRCGSY